MNNERMTDAEADRYSTNGIRSHLMTPEVITLDSKHKSGWTRKPKFMIRPKDSAEVQVGIGNVSPTVPKYADLGVRGS